MLDARGIEGVRVLVGLHALAKQHPSELIEGACEIAHGHDAFQLRAIRTLIKRSGPKQEYFEFIESHPIIRTLGEYTAAAQRAIRRHDDRRVSPAMTTAAPSNTIGAGEPRNGSARPSTSQGDPS